MQEVDGGGCYLCNAGTIIGATATGMGIGGATGSIPGAIIGGAVGCVSGIIIVCS